MKIIWGIALTEKQVHNLNPPFVAKQKLQRNGDVFLEDILREIISDKLKIYTQSNYKKQDYIVVGLSWDEFGYEETKANFLNRIKSLIEESFQKEISLSMFIFED